MDKILESLNDRQIEAVSHFTGPLIVIAGAGSGKTKALTHRIAYLVAVRDIKPWNILAVTFTNKAANEMKHRVLKLLGHGTAFGEDGNIPMIGTFHSVCVKILRKHLHLFGFENSFAIYDEKDQEILIKRILESMSLDPKRTSPKAVLSHISNAKNQLIGPEEYRQYSSDYFSEKVAEIYPMYQKNLQKNNALDFDDIIMKTVELFKKFPEILDQYQEKFKFISVDEYQDTNRAQYVLINMLAGKYRNLCVIGDADQSIYSWRGATIQNILDFEKDYPETKIVTLDQNYRSTQNILDCANQIISKNSKRKDKKLWTVRAGGDKLSEWVADNERHESELIAREISNLLRGSEYPTYNEFVVLYRTNAQSRVIEEVFLRYGIPYRIVGGIKFYQRKEIKDVLSYLRLISNPNDTVSLLRIINTPQRKIGPRTLELIRNFAAIHDISFYQAMLVSDNISEIPKSKLEIIESFIKMTNKLQDLNKGNNAADMITHVFNITGYKKMLDDGSVEGEARIENVAELISVAQKYDQLEAGMSLSIFLEEISLISDLDNLDETENAVTLMTVHSAKGLEFPNVFIAGLEEGIFPHTRSMIDREDLEEERRLLYVAMTRAKDKLYLLHARERTLYGESRTNAPSQFLEDIDETLIERNFGRNSGRKHISLENISGKPIPIETEKGFEDEISIGDKIYHDTFGNGIVINVAGGVITVAFEDCKVGVKKLALSVAPIRKV